MKVSNLMVGNNILGIVMMISIIVFCFSLNPPINPAIAFGSFFVMIIAAIIALFFTFLLIALLIIENFKELNKKVKGMKNNYITAEEAKA